MKKYPVLFFTLLLATLTGCDAQQARPYAVKTKTVTFRVGDHDIIVRSFAYGNSKDVVYIHLHDDEQTALAATRKHLANYGGLLIKLENKGKRIVRFRKSGNWFAFDPNRIFSREGVEKTLAAFGDISPDARDEVLEFARRLLDLIPTTAKFVVAVHNNTDGKFSINSYRGNGDHASDAAAVHVNERTDPDNMFLTTDSSLFKRLAAADYNVILQDNNNALRDGSLSVYYGEKNLPYLNCETQHGSFADFRRMIDAGRREIDQLLSN